MAYSHSPAIPGYYLFLGVSGDLQIFLVEQTPQGQLMIRRNKLTPSLIIKAADAKGVWLCRIYGPPGDRIIEDYGIRKDP